MFHKDIEGPSEVSLTRKTCTVSDREKPKEPAPPTDDFVHKFLSLSGDEVIMGMKRVFGRKLAGE